MRCNIFVNIFIYTFFTACPQLMFILESLDQRVADQSNRSLLEKTDSMHTALHFMSWY